MHEEKRKWVVIIRRILLFFKKISFITLSKTSDLEFQTYYKRKSNAIIPNGIIQPGTTKSLDMVRKEIEGLKENSSTKVFLNIGRIDKIKNQKMLSEVFDYLCQVERKDVILLIIGNNSNESLVYLNELINQNYKKIFFLGLKTNIADYLSCVDAFCLSSFKEGLPLVVLEAMSYGLPILSTPVGGVPDIIVNGRNGFISENFSKESYLSLVSNFLTLSDADLERISLKNKLDFEQKYTIQTTARQYLSFYNQLLTRKQSLC